MDKVEALLLGIWLTLGIAVILLAAALADIRELLAVIAGV